MSLELDVSWNSTDFNASIQTMISELYPEAMSCCSSIHRVIVNAGKKTFFSPRQLNASVGDIILFTPVRIGDRIAQVSPDQPCQSDGSLSPMNYSRLIFPYLVTTRDPAWFSAPQQDCAFRCNDTAIFSLNPSNYRTINNSTTTSDAQTIPTSVPRASHFLLTRDGLVASMLTTNPTTLEVIAISQCRVRLGLRALSYSVVCNRS